MVVPFALDKAGNKAVIDFWVRPGRQNADRGAYMVGLRFDEDKLDVVSKAEIPLKVKLLSIKNNTEIPLSFMGASVFSSFNEGRVDIDKKGGIVYPAGSRIFPLDGIYKEEKTVAVFRLTEPGRYRVYVETTRDNAALQGKQFDLYVANNNTGK